MTEPHAVAPGLRHFPLPLFAAVLGIAGLGLAWREAGRVLGAPAWAGEFLLLAAAAAFVLIAVAYLLKWRRYPAAVATEFRHPVRGHFVPAITVALILLSNGLLPHRPDLASGLWLGATIVHLLLAVWLIRRLLVQPAPLAALTPAIFIPLVGNILAPLAGMKLGYVGLSWFSFAIGLGLWIAIQPPLLHRLFWGDALPPRLQPAVAILLAPPSVGCLAWSALNNGETDALNWILAGLAGFIGLLLLSLLPRFIRLAFAPSWWAYTFPSAAFSLMLIHLSAAGPKLHPAVGWTALAVATAVVALVAFRTISAATSGHLFKPED